MKFGQKFNNLVVLILIIAVSYGCSEVESDGTTRIAPKSEKFGEYWYQGMAELNRYELEQVRYGEVRQGDAVLIYVTEDFLKKEQVKYENIGDKIDVQTVFKLNFNRRFYTGIYPYSLLTSVFSPIHSEGDHVLKITSTAQEWCGHTFMQLNNRNNKFRVQLNSYFQTEADKEFDVEQEWLEDEVWTLVRINPDLLPVGEIDIIPGMQYVRLFHKEFKSEPATAEKKEMMDAEISPNSLIQYAIQYHELPRSLTITYEKESPYQILAWQETYQSKGEASEGDLLITKAKRTKKIMLDYWSKNSVADSIYRVELGLTN